MTSRKETERAKQIQEKCLMLLTEMLRDEDNKYCVDCDAKGPRWASWNLGIFLCIRCAGIHRNLGVHISKVKSVNLDSWTPSQVVSLQQMGNSRARAVYENYLPDGFRRPQTDSALESFIRAKYEHKKYLAREWVPPPPPKVDWDKEIDEELEKQKKKKKSGATTNSLGNLTSSVGAITKSNPVTIKNTLPAPISKPRTTASSPKAVRTDNLDLLGLSSPTKSSNDDLDVFSGFLSAAPATTTASQLTTKSSTEKEPITTNVPALSTNDNFSSLAQEVDFFNHVPNGSNKTTGPNAAAAGKLTKDSILALYGQAPTSGGPSSLGNYNPQQQQQQQQPGHMFGQPASLPQQNLYNLPAQTLNQFGGQPQMYPGQQMMQQPQQQQQNGQMQFNLGAAVNPNMMFGGGYNSQPVQQQAMFAQFPGQMMPHQQQPQQPPQPSTINLINKINNMPSATQPPTADLSKNFGNLNFGNVWP